MTHSKEQTAQRKANTRKDSNKPRYSKNAAKVRTEEAKKQVEWAHMNIRTIRTLHGLRYAVVSEPNGFIVELPENKIAIYDYSEGGLNQAREVMRANNQRKPA